MIWEYRVESFGFLNLTEIQDRLDQLGLEGWECYHVSESLRTYFLKRPKQGKGD